MLHVNPHADRKPPAGGRRLSRRALLYGLAGTGTLFAGGGGALGYARYVEPYWPVLERRRMVLPKLPPGLAGLQIAQLSDLHLSECIPPSFLQEHLARVVARQPALIFLTGDYVTAGNWKWIQQLPNVLRGLSAPCGVYAVLGNHDYGVYHPFPTPRGRGIGDRVTAALEQIGIVVLRNTACVVEVAGARLQLVGVDDEWSGYCDPEAAFAGADPDLATIALTHNPDTVVERLAHCAYDWVLCGHTHGGQVRIPFYGAPVLPIRNRRYDAGEFDVHGKKLYVNRGLGCIRQVRFNCRPEMTLFTLAQA